MNDRDVPKPQPPPPSKIQRSLARRPRNDDRLKVDRAHTPRPWLPFSRNEPQFGSVTQLQVPRAVRLVVVPQSLSTGSLPSWSTVQVRSLPYTSPMSDHCGWLPHIVSSSGGS